MNLSIADLNNIHGFGAYSEPGEAETVYLRFRDRLDPVQAFLKTDEWMRVIDVLSPALKAAGKIHADGETVVAQVSEYIRERHYRMYFPGN